MKVKLKGKKFINTVVSGTDEVQNKVKIETEVIASKAMFNLARHWDNSDAEHHWIDTSYGSRDGYVSLIGPAPMSLEFGHMLVFFGKPTAQYIQGLHILYRAAGLM